MRLFRTTMASLAALAVFACGPEVPEYESVSGVRHLDQGISADDRKRLYHYSQGTRFMEYDWFVSLEQSNNRRMFASMENLGRFGFLPSSASDLNPDALPVGFAKDIDRDSGLAFAGLTCAACHTGQVNTQGVGIRIDGGAALVDTDQFLTAMFRSLAITRILPTKFARFADRVLGEGHSAEDRDRLRAEVDAVIDRVKDQQRINENQDLYPVAEGPGRTDALGRGGNLVFGTQLSPANYRTADAPVRFPSLWDIWSYDWVQYNASIHQPMARNVAEALGVRALVTLRVPPNGTEADLYQSTVRLEEIDRMERILQKLEPPPWPEDLLGEIDREKWQEGRELYQARCAGCHDPAWRTVDRFGNPGRRMITVPLEKIGTDPKAATNFVERTVDTGDLGLGTVSAGEALRVVTGKVIERRYDELGIPEEKRLQMSGCRENDWRAPLAYKAKPLDGIWSTAPYLHNGSVPSIYQLLLPAAERDTSFYVGTYDYDAVHMGYETSPIGNGFRFDTTIPGNSNAGHEFRDGSGPGVIGPAFTDAERFALIEFLKAPETNRKPPVRLEKADSGTAEGCRMPPRDG